MAKMLRGWEPQPSSSAIASTNASSRSLTIDTSITSDQRSDHLSTKEYGIDDSDSSMGLEQWFSLAVALDLNPSDDSTSNPDFSKIAQKIKKRRNISDKDMTEILTTLLVSIASPHPRILIAKNAPFNREAVPPEIPKFGIDSRLKIRLPTPRPAIVVGYNPQVFNSHYLELLQGIISDPRGDPQDLGRISQTTSGIYWPFFVVNIDAKSMLGARNACAGATATCNNALMMLAGALIDHRSSEYDEGFVNSLSRAVHSFSLSVSGKTACLMTHNSEACLAEAVGIVRSYDLDQERDVQALSTRIRSIIMWGQKARLQAILDLLDRFDLRVNFKESSMAQETISKLPLEYENPDVSEAKKRKSFFKAVLAESMPTWSRVEV